MQPRPTPYGFWRLDDVNSGIGPIGLPEGGFHMFFAFSEEGNGSFSTLPAGARERLHQCRYRIAVDPTTTPGTLILKADTPEDAKRDSWFGGRLFYLGYAVEGERLRLVSDLDAQESLPSFDVVPGSGKTVFTLTRVQGEAPAAS